MPCRKEKFDNGNIVHVMLKGVDSNEIFKDIDDCYRGVFSVYEFNDVNPANIQKRRKNRKSFKKKVGLGRTSPHFLDERERMVDVLCFCFMPNHIHLLVKQLRDNGITEFMRKVGTGYGGYIVRKYKKQGHVFQSSFAAVKIKTDEQLKVVFAYIHTNSISLIYKDWKTVKIKDKNFQKIKEFLESYKGSSYPDYVGIQNFPSVTQREFMLELFGGEANCKEFVENYIKNKGESKEITELFLE